MTEKDSSEYDTNDVFFSTDRLEEQICGYHSHGSASTFYSER
jgi:hypothetical protein